VSGFRLQVLVEGGKGPDTEVPFIEHIKNSHMIVAICIFSDEQAVFLINSVR